MLDVCVIVIAIEHGSPDLLPEAAPVGPEAAVISGIDHAVVRTADADAAIALYRDGRQAESLDVYQRTRDLLLTELGLDPGPALQRLQQAILRQEPSLDVASAAPERSILVAPRNQHRLDAAACLRCRVRTRAWPVPCGLAAVITALCRLG